MSDNEGDKMDCTPPVDDTLEESVHTVEETLDDCAWPDATTSRIIELWRERPILYDVTHRHYLNRDRKAQALSEIATEVKITGKCLYMIKGLI
jgi:hypothetical protein